MAKRLRCRLGLHKWTSTKTADNQPYRACVDCGTEDVRGEGRRGGPDPRKLQRIADAMPERYRPHGSAGHLMRLAVR